MVRLMQTVLLSCIDTNTVSKRTETRFAMTHVTLEFYRVRPKWFSSIWYIQHKACTYHASRLALSPNGPKQAFTWVSSPRSTIRCVQNDFWAYGTVGANRASILLRHKYCLWMDRNGIPHEPCHLAIPSGASKMISKPMVHSAQTVHLSCVKITT
jgi:hypothetical protein